MLEVASRDEPADPTGLLKVDPPRRSTRRSLAFAVCLLALFTMAAGLASGAGQGRLTDTDAYTWTYRALELRADGDWYDDTLDGVDPPAGHAQHWSRPFDLLLLVGGLIGEPIAGFKSSLLTWGIVLPCLLGVATLTVLWWGFADLLDDAGRDAMAMLAGLQSAIIAGFMAGRADHQALMGLLMIAVVGLCRRGFGARSSTRAAVIAGGLSGLALWIGMEAALLVMSVVAAVTGQWVIRGDGTVRRLRAYAVALAASSSAGLVLEHGAAALSTVELDELSVTFVAAALLMAAAFHGLTSMSHRLTTPLRRSAALGVVSLLALGTLILLSPDIVRGPLGGVDPLYARTRLRHIDELQPVFTPSLALTVSRAATGLSLVPLALLHLSHRIRARSDILSPGLHVLLVPAAVYLAFGVVQQRWLFTLNLLLVVPAALGVQRLMHRAAPSAGRVTMKMAAVAAIAALWWVPVSAAALADRADVPRCDTDAVVAALADVPDGSKVMAFVDYGPELLVRTGHRVLSIPNHRPQPGYASTYRALSAHSADVARRIVDDRDVQVVAVCTDSVEAAFYGDDPASLHARLRAGDAPAWLRELPVPAEPPRFRIYSVHTNASS